MVYVASSGRPIHELLAPAAPLSEELYREEFVGMARQPVSWDALIGVPEAADLPAVRWS